MPAKTLPNTGERLIPDFSRGKLVYGEHVIRYLAAAELVKNKTVLDVASGEGYGTALLGKSARQTTGVDVDKVTIKHAQKKYSSSKVKFIKGNGRKLPLKDQSVDVVVSFETIEHVKDYKNFMSEIKRVLKSDGLLILSTPNDLEYPEGNHFHLHEFKQAELESLVKKYFSNLNTYYQGSWLYSALFDNKLLTKPDSYKLDTIQLAPIKTNQSIYLFLIASNRSIQETVKPLAAISEHWSERDNVAKEQAIEKERGFHIATIRRLEKTVDEKHEALSTALKELAIYKNKFSTVAKKIAWSAYRKATRVKRVAKGNTNNNAE